MTRESMLEELYGGLWHLTKLEYYESILNSGQIISQPPHSNWKPLGDEKECCSYARTLDGVSLFDFEEFNPETYEQEYPLSTWAVFVPYLEGWHGGVWIEIDRLKVAANLISRTEVVERWKKDRAYRHNFMPKLEAIHIGPVPKQAFIRAILIRDQDTSFQRLTI